CGDGIVDADEECDDKNPVDGDGCDSNCTRTRCGNGLLTPGEQCDPPDPGKGCSEDCQVEPGFVCTGQPSKCMPGVSGCCQDGTNCDDNNKCTTGDHCEGGVVVGTPIDCDDHNACTIDSCDPATGLCVHAPMACPVGG